MTDALQTAIDAHIAHLRLNRPESHNAIDGDIMNGLALCPSTATGRLGHLLQRRGAPE